MAILKSSDYTMQAVNILLRINQDKLKHVHQPFGQLEYVFVSKKEELVLCKYSLIFFGCMFLSSSSYSPLYYQHESYYIWEHI